MRKIYVIVVLALLVMGSCSQQVGDNALTSSERAQGWRLLFDGESMDQWRNFNQDTIVGWVVEDDCMVVLGERGSFSQDLITKDQFENFELYLEWKATPEANSGIFYLAQEVEGVRVVWAVAPEYQIIDDVGYPGNLTDGQKTGANYDMHPPDFDNWVVHPVGEFNSSMIRIKDGYVEHYLNDKLVVGYHLWDEEWDSLRMDSKWKDFPHYGQFRKGHIGLQDHGDRLYFKNIKVREL